MRILVLGAGVVGSVYAGRLIQAGHDVVLLARGQRLADLRARGLILVDAESGRRSDLPVSWVSELSADDCFDLVLVAVRAEQLASTLPVLSAMGDGSDVLFFGNTANRQPELVTALGGRALFGFPAVGGTRDGPVVRYVTISQQKTMLGEPDGVTGPRLQRLRDVFTGAGFTTSMSADIDGWLLGHAAFVVPIAFALYRVGVDPARLAADRATMRLMVRATRQAFAALQAAGNTQIPTNLRMLYRLPTHFISAYWRHVFNSAKGELWFAAHSRAAPEEMHALAHELHEALTRTTRTAPDLELLLAAE